MRRYDVQRRGNWEIVYDPHDAYPRRSGYGYRYLDNRRPHQIFVYAPSYTVQVPRDYQPRQAQERRRSFPWRSVLGWTVRVGVAAVCFYLAWQILAGGPASLLGTVKAASGGHLAGLLPPKPF